MRGRCKFGGSREAMMFEWLIGWEGPSFFALLSSCCYKAELRSNCGGAQCTTCIFYDHFRPCSITLAFLFRCCFSPLLPVVVILDMHFRDGILGLSTVSKTPTAQIIHTSNRNPDDRRTHKHKCFPHSRQAPDNQSSGGRANQASNRSPNTTFTTLNTTKTL